MKTFKLYLLRHGLTEANLNGIYAGSGTDLPLSDEGVAQLDRLREDFDYPRAGLVFVSPLLRARQSADILYPACARSASRICGRSILGSLRAKRWRSCRRTRSITAGWTPRSSSPRRAARAGRAFAQRAGAVLEKLCEYMVRSDTPEAAVVTHGGSS